MKDDNLAFGGHPRNIQYTTKVAKLSNQTESGIARVLADESDNFLERQYGRLIAVIDVNFTDDTYDISEVIVDTLRQEFYGDLNRSVRQSFEHALTAVNQTLADLAAEGQNDWVGKLNAILGVVHENEIHLSQVGNAQAYLVRGHAATHITDGLSRHAGGATAKTFLNVASGAAEVGDKVLISSGELFYHLSVSDIRRYLYLHHPTRAIRKIADQVTEKGTPGRLAATVIELTTIDLISAETVTHEPDEIVLGAPRRHFERLQRFKPFRQETPLAAGLSFAKKYYDQRLKPNVAAVASAIRHRGGQRAAKPQAAAGTPETTRQPKTTPKDGVQRFAHSSFTSLRTGSTAATKHLRHHASPLTRRVSELWKKSGIPRSEAWQKFAGLTRTAVSRLWRSPLRRFIPRADQALYRNLLILGVAILVVSLALSFKAGNDRQADGHVRDQIKQIQEQQAKAETNYVVKDFDGARRQLDQARGQADSLAKQPRLKADVTALQSSILESYDHINNIVAVPDAPLADIASGAPGARPQHLALSGATIYTIGDTGALYATDSQTKETKVASANPGITGSIKSLTTNVGGNVLFLTDKPSVFTLDAATNQVAEAALGAGGTWEASTALDTVQQNLYVLDPAHNQIWRHAKTLTGYNKGEAYVQGDVDLKNAVDVVTGAQVYVLKSDGSLQLFVGGAPQSFKAAPPPEPQNALGPTPVLAVNSTTGLSYIADPQNHRIIENNAKGEYVRQFRLEAFQDIHDLAVDEKSNVLSVLAGTKIYQVNLAG